MQNIPKYLISISLPIRLNDDRDSWEWQMQEPELFDFNQIDEMNDYIQNRDNNFMQFELSLIKPNYIDSVYFESERWNYEDFDWKWNIETQVECNSIEDIEKNLNNWQEFNY